MNDQNPNGKHSRSSDTNSISNNENTTHEENHQNAGDISISVIEITDNDVKIEQNDTKKTVRLKQPNARDRWGRLKNTMAATNHVMQPKKKSGLDRGDSFLRKFSTRNHLEAKTVASENEDGTARPISRHRHATLQYYVVHPSGGLMFYWLGVVTLSVMYNLWTCIAREAFREIQEGRMAIWFSLDGICDFIYVFDLCVQFRTGYLDQGLMVYDSSKLFRNYYKSKGFIIDVVCLLPLDFLQFYTGVHAMLRFPRFLKCHRCMRFLHMYESRTAYPNLFRVANLSHILFLGAHWFAAFYYLISEAEDFEGSWSYPKPEGTYGAVTRKYLASLYWSTLTLTTIGDLPPPDSNWQYVFVIVSYLIGVFIFATIVGQVGNVITNRNASRQEFERLLDGAKFYMQMHNVPPELQKRVQRWYDYVWTRGRLNCNDINSLGLLPDKLKTELALHVNLGTLKKSLFMSSDIVDPDKAVTIFQKCRPEFLHDLMLKMRAFIFTPGDLICRRGEVAREMFIIADGVVEILGENSTVLTQMSTGDFFGEIGILNLDGGINRRTADVRSVGYAELFVLSRDDVLAALKDHPDAEQIIREYGQRRLKETEEHRKLARSTPNSPEPSSSSWRRHRTLSKGSKPSSQSNRLHPPQNKYLQSLQKIPNVMSPKNLRKMLNIRSRRVRTQEISPPVGVETDASQGFDDIAIDKQSESSDGLLHTESSKSMSPNDLNTINETFKRTDNGSVQNRLDVPRNSVTTNTGTSKLADVVLQLLTNRQSKKSNKYAEVNSDEIEELSNTQTQNVGDNICSGHVTSTDKCDKTVSTCSKRRNSNRISGARTDNQNSVSDLTPAGAVLPCDRVRRRGFQHIDVSSDEDSDKDDGGTGVVRKDIPVPKIVFTNHSTVNSSESDGGPPSTPPPIFRNHVSRRSFSCATSKLSPERPQRRLSCPPPLSLPIEVPTFTHFQGRPNAPAEVSQCLNEFQQTVERRLESLETTYQASMERLEESARIQEEMMQYIIKKLSKSKGKVADSGGMKTEDLAKPRVKKPPRSARDKPSADIISENSDAILTPTVSTSSYAQQSVRGDSQEIDNARRMTETDEHSNPSEDLAMTSVKDVVNVFWASANRKQQEDVPMHQEAMINLAYDDVEDDINNMKVTHL